MYIMNIQDIFSGKVKADTVQSIDSLTILRSDSFDGTYQAGRRVSQAI